MQTLLNILVIGQHVVRYPSPILATYLCLLAGWLVGYCIRVFTCIHVQTIAERHENVKHGSVRQKNNNNNNSQSNSNSKKYCEKYRCKRLLKQEKSHTEFAESWQMKREFFVSFPCLTLF